MASKIHSKFSQEIQSVLRSTNPVEIICSYNDESDEKMAQLSIRIQELLELTVRDLRTNFTDLPPHRIKELTDTLQEIQVSTHIFGPYGSYQLVDTLLLRQDIFTLELKSTKCGGTRLVIDVLKEIHNLCMNVFDQFKDPLRTLETLNSFTTPHVKRLLEILRQSSLNNETGNSLRCMVLVDRHSSARTLFTILQVASQIDPELSFLQPLITMGSTSGNPIQNLLEKNNYSENQKNAIQNFQDGKYNLMVANSFLEESVEVPACNLVIRFDGIKSFSDYVQSKEHARSLKSFYILMVSENQNEDFLEVISHFHAIEQMFRDPNTLNMMENDLKHKTSDTIVTQLNERLIWLFGKPQ